MVLTMSTAPRLMDIEARVMEGQSWRDFCRALEAAGDIVLARTTPGSPIDRAEGYRYLTRLTRIGLEMMLEHSDPDFPTFYSASHPTGKIGGDNPDNLYQNATIAGDREYRIYGRRNTVPYLSFGTKANRYATEGTMASTGELEAADMTFGRDGGFEITVSRERRPGNWLPLAADTSMLLVRQTFLDRPNEIAADVRIERVGGPATPEPLTPQKLDRGLAAAAAFVTGTARTFVNWVEEFRNYPNAFAPFPQETCYRTGGDPLIHYLHGYWQLGADEALVTDTEVPECEIWNFQLDNYWMESLDYRYLPACWNKHTAKYNADGSVTFVIAARDPGVGNYMDTAGHTCGSMLLRWTRAKTYPLPRCRVVKLSTLTPPTRGAQ
jgi:hypothetical protein